MPHHDSIERINEGEWRWELDPDQSLFHFSCSACGSCCTGDMTICLNLADLQRMAAFVGVDRVGQLFELGYVDELTLEKGGFRPVIRFKTKPFKFCPFLENRLEDDGNLLGLCRLHPDLKPLVCKLAPIGRELILTGKELISSETWFFTEPVSGCPGCRRVQEQSVKPWVKSNARELDWEIRYFRILERYQQQQVDISVFRNFHRQLEVSEPIEIYLNRHEGCERNAPGA